MQPEDKKPSDIDAKEAYQFAADTIGGVPSLRWKDNLIQAIAILASVIVGALIGFLVTFNGLFALVGAFAGLVGGLLVSGIVLMILGWIRAAKTVKKLTNSPADIKGGMQMQSRVVQTIPLSGFDPKGEPEIRVWNDGSLQIVFNFMPPSFVPDEENQDEEGLGPFKGFDKEIEVAVGTPVMWEDREVFRIQRPLNDTVERLRRFIEQHKAN
jgi:uncharacterized membrane protein required for colicin V production